MSDPQSKLNDEQVEVLGRLSYPKLFVAETVKAERNNPNAKKRYGCQILMPKSEEATKARIELIMRRLIKDKLKGVSPKKKDLCIRDGDGEEEPPENNGFWVISANRNEKRRDGRPNPPAVYDRDGRTQLTQNDTRPYAGCWCQYLISIYVPPGWDRIAAGLEIVRFWKDGEPFETRSADVALMSPLPDNDDEDEGGFGLE